MPRDALLGPNGDVYAQLEAIVRFDPATYEPSVVATPPVNISVGGPLVDGRIYFGSSSHMELQAGGVGSSRGDGRQRTLRCGRLAESAKPFGVTPARRSAGVQRPARACPHDGPSAPAAWCSRPPSCRRDRKRRGSLAGPSNDV